MTDKYYKEFNPNPLGKEVGDCQIRALCAVTGQSWYEIYDKLVMYGREKACPFYWTNPDDNYYKDLFGMIRYKLKREKGKKALDVKTFCKTHPTGKYILGMANHVVGVVDGLYYDLYPGLGDSTVYTYYEYTGESLSQTETLEEILKDKLKAIKDFMNFEFYGNNEWVKDKVLKIIGSDT